MQSRACVVRSVLLASNIVGENINLLCYKLRVVNKQSEGFICPCVRISMTFCVWKYYTTIIARS